jgi:acylphosphatase
MEEFRAIVSGRVQMVMFRDFTTRKARKVGVTGFVRNMQDGTVEVVAQGTKENLEKLITQLHEGPMFAKVTSVAVEWRKVVQRYPSFEIRH